VKADGIPEGTIGVHDMNTRQIVTRPAGEPDENQELFIVQYGSWVPYRHNTMQELIDAIRADLIECETWREAAEERLDELEKLL